MKPFRVVILRCVKRVMDMHDLARYLTPPSMKGKRYEASNFKVFDQEFTGSDIHAVIKYILPSSMQYELEDHQKDYRSLTYEYWCNLLSTIDIKYNRKREATQIKNISSTRAASLSDINGCVRIHRKNKSILGAGVLRSNKESHNKAPKHPGTPRHCVLCKKVGIPERKYILIVLRIILVSIPTRRP